MKISLKAAVTVVAFIAVISAAIPAAGEWIENGTPICTVEGSASAPDIFWIENGVVVAVWEDARGSDIDIYAQVIDPYGDTHWTMDGVPVCTATGNQRDPCVVWDRSGGVIIVWEDYRSGQNDIYAQRLFDGAVQWTANGVTVCNAVGDQYDTRAVPDGTGGAIITWVDQRYVSDWDIYAQRIDSNGAVQWIANGVSVCFATGDQKDPEIVMDGEGGAVIVWYDISVSGDLAAQRVDHDGILQWPYGGVVVTGATGNQQNQKVQNDGTGGVIVAWQDNRTVTDYDIYAQRIDGNGVALWTVNGEPVCTSSDNQFVADIVSDQNGGAIIVWTDNRNGDADAYAQRVNRNGLDQWPANGVPAVIQGDIQLAEAAFTDGAGGVIITMMDYRNGDWDLYVQRLNPDGNQWWAYDGLPLCDYSGDQNGSRIFSDGAGGAIVVWIDGRNESIGDVFAQRIGPAGFWGYPCPLFNAVVDVPHDQGGRVTLTWEPSRLDRYSEEGIQYYSIWRQLGELETQALLDTGAKETPAPLVGAEFEGEAFRFVSLENATFGFEWLENVDAHHLGTYTNTAATLYDSTALDPGLHTFMISAHHYPDVYWDSHFIPGYSVDNLSPCTPLALAGEQSFIPAGLELTWTPNTEEDLGGYRIYRDIGPYFEPGPGNLLETTCDTLLLDGEWTSGSEFCYKVTAFDIHGNESGHAVLCSSEVTGDDPIPLPNATYLEQNYPNPFNPVTNIGFGIKEPGHVSLRVYDAAGRLVTTLVDESRPAGSWTVEWNGRDNKGGAVASGVYFYKLVAGDFVRTRKMVLLQ